MVVGENSRENDIYVNVTKEKKLTNMRAAGADEALQLIPPKILGLDQAIEFIKEDELVEVTPLSVRIRTRILYSNKRPRHKRWVGLCDASKSSLFHISNFAMPCGYGQTTATRHSELPTS